MRSDKHSSKKTGTKPYLKMAKLQLSAYLAGKEVRIIDNLNSSKIEFNIEGLALGLYNLKVSSNSGISKIFKLVKQ